MLIVYVYNKLFLGELIMKKTKMFSAMTAAAVAALSMSAVAAVPAFADDVDLDGVYHAYIGVQSASYTFRNAYDDAQYGYGTKADDGTVWFDQLTGWDGPTAVNKPTTFNDAVIKGNGTYKVSMSDFDFGEDETLNLLFVSTNIPLNDQVKVTDVNVYMDGQKKYTFDEAYMNPDATTYMNWQQINIWNEDLGKEDGLFGYVMPQDNISIEFTVSGFNYDKAEGDDDAEAASDGAFDPNGEYGAFIGVQSASFTFRNAYDDAQYGYGTKADDGTVWFDQLTGWDGPTAVNKPTTFNDAVIKGNGTYKVSMSDFDFGEDETLNLLFVSTNIPLNDQVKVTDVNVYMDGQKKYTFDEAYMNPDATTYMNWQQINIWNEDLGKEDGLFGYTMPQDSIEIEFTISGFAYDNTDSAEAEETTTAAEEETEAETTAAEETEAEASAAETEAASAPAESSSGNAGVIIAIVAVVIVAAVVVVIVIKKKNG